MALKIGYYFSPTIKTPAPFGGGVQISPKFAANVDAMGGQWASCWIESDDAPLYGIYKIGIPLGASTSGFELGGVNLISNLFADAQASAALNPQIGAANAARMINPHLTGE